MSVRQVIALLGLGGIFLGAYLTLFHYGYVGSLACGTGACEKVQTSKWSVFLGYPVALWGLGYYLAVFVAAIAGAVGPGVAARWPTRALLAMNGIGVAFSGYLTWAEVARIHALCRYCVVSACLTIVLFALSLYDWRATRAASDPA